MGFQLNTDFTGIVPDEGGGRSYFPVSDSRGWLCQITDSKGTETNKKDGTRLDIVLTGLEGPVQGKLMDWNINVANPSQKAVEIGFAQMSAIAHVTGHIRVGNSSEWHNKPFRAMVIADPSEQYPHATKVAKILDLNGNSAKNAGQGVMGGGQQTTTQTGQGGGNWGNQPNAQNSSPQSGGVGSQGGQNAGGFASAGNNGQQGFQPPSGGAPQFNPQQQQPQGNFQGSNPQQGGQFGQQQPQGGQFNPQGQQGGFQQNNGGAGPGWNQ